MNDDIFYALAHPRSNIDELQARTEPASKIGDAVINVADKIHAKVKE